jgi:putative Holliday junction resolvase
MPDPGLLLCIDYGTAKVGVAVGSLLPTTPLEVVRYANPDELYQRLLQLVKAEQPVGMVIGWPADHLTIATPQTEQIRLFGEHLGRLTGLPIVYHPETLTTQTAMKRMLAAGVSKQRRRQVEDSYAAAAILDDYLLGVAS